MKITCEAAQLVAWYAVAPRFREKLPRPSIDRIINEKTGIKADSQLINALTLVRLRRANGDNAHCALAPSEWDLYNNPRRHNLMKRWSLRLEQAGARSFRT